MGIKRGRKEQRRVAVVKNPITLDPECLSLKAVGQQISREHLSPLDLPPQKP